MKIKNIKPIAIAIFVLACCQLNPIKAQMHYLGMSRQIAIHNENSATGIEYQNFHYWYNFGGGFALMQPEIQPGSKTYLNLDVNLLPFHHACLLNRLVPYVGVQYETINGQISQEGFKKEFNQQLIFPKAGLKLSYDRFIASCEYQFNSTKCVSAKLFYTIFIRNRCIKKRIDEFNATDFSQF